LQELLKKGINRQMSERITEELYNEMDEAELANKALEKKLNSLRKISVELARRKASDYLRRKGFSFSIIRKVLTEKLGHEVINNRGELMKMVLSL